ncbi:hypothetical protein EON63_02330 [archaeon]|nr:MAG: hypothetical protein EON63_02330 [archaeon]
MRASRLTESAHYNNNSAHHNNSLVIFRNDHFLSHLYQPELLNMRQAFDLFTLPGTMLAVTASILCIVFGYLIMAAATPRHVVSGDADSNVKRVASAVDMSSSLRQEESLNTNTAPSDGRVLNPIEFRKFKVLEVCNMCRACVYVYAQTLSLVRHITITIHIS